jgi:hypothetical protein
MALILALNTIIEGFVGLLFLFYPNAGDFVPGFGDGNGNAYELLLKLYGVASLFVASLSGVTYFSREHRVLVMTSLGLLGLFHAGISVVSFLYHPDPRAGVLHFLLFLFFAAAYIQRRNLLTTTPTGRA